MNITQRYRVALTPTPTVQAARLEATKHPAHASVHPHTAGGPARRHLSLGRTGPRSTPAAGGIHAAGGFATGLGSRGTTIVGG